jgi:ABC-type oligopeptide transport system substrate-binding subunit
MSGPGGRGFFNPAWVDNKHDSASATSQLTLKPNPHWWGLSAGRRPHFSEVDILVGNLDTFLGDASIGYGDVLGPGLLARALPQIKQTSYYHETPSFSVAMLYFNWKQAPFDDLNARKAFCLAINRAQLDQQTRQGIDIPGWHITPQGMAGYDAQLQGPDGAPAAGDTTLARRYWQAYLAAHGNHAPRVTIPGWWLFPNAVNAVKPLAQMWKHVLNVDVTGYTSNVQEPALAAQMNDFVESVDYPDPENVLSWMAAENGYGVTVPAASPLLRQADALSDMAARAPLYHQAEQMLIDNVAICPLFQVVDAYALRSWVKGGFAQNGLGVVPNDDWVSGYIAKH